MSCYSEDCRIAVIFWAYELPVRNSIALRTTNWGVCTCATRERDREREVKVYTVRVIIFDAVVGCGRRASVKHSPHIPPLCFTSPPPPRAHPECGLQVRTVHSSPPQCPPCYLLFSSRSLKHPSLPLSLIFSHLPRRRLQQTTPHQLPA